MAADPLNDIKVTAFVPMRHASARVPGKNYRPFAGRPLYHHIVSTLLAVPYVERVIIDTDSPTITDDARAEFGESVYVQERPQHLLGEFASIHEILIFDADAVGATELCLHTHSTNPLLRASTISHAIETFVKARPRYDSLFTVTPRQVRFYWPDGRPINHDPDNLIRTQDLPEVYEENSCLYLFERSVLTQRRNRIGERPMMYPISGDETVDIDDEDSWRLAQALHAARQSRSDDLR